jgi:cytochrome oxidase Cu insertion factor (SCO1/SenC/PrrC family)
VNYGELIAPRALPDASLQTADGRPFRFSQMKGEWVLLTVDRAACDEGCRTKLIYTRQVRLAQGKDAERIERVWLLTDAGTPDPALLAEQPGLTVLRAGGSEVVRSLPANASPADHIYVVDPLGNLMMRFPQNPDPRRMLKDVARLLRHSKWK